MAEYIDKQAAIEQIKAEWAKLPLCETTGFAVMMRTLVNLTAADVRPVVLCKNCKWTETDGMEDPAIYCEKWDRWEMPPDGFCWLGKKREKS